MLPHTVVDQKLVSFQRAVSWFRDDDGVQNLYEIRTTGSVLENAFKDLFDLIQCDVHAGAVVVGEDLDSKMTHHIQFELVLLHLCKTSYLVMKVV